MRSFFLRLFFGALAGFSAGSGAAVFLLALGFITDLRLEHPEYMWGLPLMGGLIGFAFSRFASNASRGTHLVIDEIRDPRKVLPFRMAPFVILSSLGTHLVGASAGREGAAVQIGASLADQWTRVFKLQLRDRIPLLMAGIAGGFGAALGTPWAGMVFGLEVVEIGRVRWQAMPECLLASFAGVMTMRMFGIHHGSYPVLQMPPWRWETLIAVAVGGVCFGFAATAFSRVTHELEHFFRKNLRHPALQGLVGGAVLLLLFWWDGTQRFVGLSFPLLARAFAAPQGFEIPLLKGVFTAVTVSAGFKGGEFVPLVIIGATLGSALSTVLAAPMTLLAATGFVATFAGAANTPWACTVLAMEIFGPSIAPYAAVACFMAYFSSTHKGIYHTQTIGRNKHERAMRLWMRFRHTVDRRDKR